MAQQRKWREVLNQSIYRNYIFDCGKNWFICYKYFSHYFKQFINVEITLFIHFIIININFPHPESNPQPYRFEPAALTIRPVIFPFARVSLTARPPWIVMGQRWDKSRDRGFIT
jgi:hypothetical protein